MLLGSSAIFALTEVADPLEGHVGVGWTIAGDTGVLTVEYVATASPAAQAGIRKRDRITAIDGIPTKGMALAQARQQMKGPIGSTVKLTLQREGAGEQQISLVRRSVIETYLPGANAGEARAQYYLGYFHAHGPPAAIDLATADDWYRKAADQGFAPAEVQLGYALRRGLGIAKDPATGAAWTLKAARQGDPVGEREMAFFYLDGAGVPPSDRDAFAWFYSAARQDDPVAEQDLGFLYRKGRGVPRNDAAAFAWYYRSAEQQNHYGEWGLAYMYDYGLGVPRNSAEALRWYQKAQVGLPQNEKLKAILPRMSVQVFLETGDAGVLDSSAFTGAFRRSLLAAFTVLAAIYVVGGLVLFYFTFRRSGAPPRLTLAFGWLGFYLESQGVALGAVLFFGSSLGRDPVILALTFLGALPVIASSCGPNRGRIWKASPLEWRTVLTCLLGACLIVSLVMGAYVWIYSAMEHAHLPVQPTQILVSNAKHASAWLAYAGIGVALPLAEEIIFRSYLFDALRRRFSGTIVVVITAALFSLVHFQVFYFVPLFGFGLVLGWLRLKTDSLRLPVLLHVMNNSLFLASMV